MHSSGSFCSMLIHQSVKCFFFLVALFFTNSGVARGDSNSSVAVTLTCVSDERQAASVIPIATLSMHYTVGRWVDGRWVRYKNDETDNNTAPIKGYGEASLTFNKLSQTFKSVVSVRMGARQNRAIVSEKEPRLLVEFSSISALLSRDAKIVLISSGKKVATLVCSPIEPEESQLFEGNNVSVNLKKQDDSKSALFKSNSSAVASPSPSSSPKVPDSNNRKKYCNKNVPVGTAWCEDGAFRYMGTPNPDYSEAFPEYENIPLEDRSVKKGEFCSTISQADAEQMARTEADARARARIICIFVVVGDSCPVKMPEYRTCPDGTIEDLDFRASYMFSAGVRCLNQGDHCYMNHRVPIVSPRSLPDAIRACENRLRSQRDCQVCLEYKPRCIDLPKSPTPKATPSPSNPPH